MGHTGRAGDDKVLSYGDNLLRQSDLDLLDGPYWLNDQVRLGFKLSALDQACYSPPQN